MGIFPQKQYTFDQKFVLFKFIQVRTKILNFEIFGSILRNLSKLYTI